MPEISQELIKRYLKLHVSYRKIGGMHYVWLGPVGFSFWLKAKAKAELSSRSGEDYDKSVVYLPGSRPWQKRA